MIKKTRIDILSIIALVLLLVNENAVEVDCEPYFNEENLLQNPENLFGLIFTQENQINAIHLHDKNLVKLVTSSKPRNPIFSCKRKTLYWIDKSSKILACEYLHSQSIKLIFEDKSSGIAALALDCRTDKLYMGNTRFRTIEVIDLKTGKHGIVRSQTLPQIISIAIDPNEGYMFILGPTEVIRMDLDGLNFQYIFEGPADMFDHYFDGPYVQYILQGPDSPTHIHFRNYSNNNFLALNSIEKRAYWMKVETMDTVKATIWSSTYDGTDLKFHIRLEVDPQFTTEDHLDIPIYSPMTFLSNIPYWVNNNQGVIKRINLNNTNDGEVIYKGTPKQMFSVTSINCNLRDQHPVKNPCDQENGGCQHLCILSRSSKSKYRCFCHLAYELSNDSKSCILPTKFIMINQEKFIRGISWREDTKQYIDVLDPLKHTPGPGDFLHIDIEDGVMYHPYPNLQIPYVPLYSQIFSVDFNNTKNMTLQPDFLAEHVTDIAFDWASKNLYYFSDWSAYNRNLRFLCVLNVKNPTYNKILASSKNFRKGLVVHPNRGYVFFTECMTLEFNDLIRVNTDGSNLIMLHKKRIRIFNIAIDYLEDKVYWTENESLLFDSHKIIYCSNLDGKNVMKVGAQFLDEPIINNMVIYGDWIYITNRITQNLERVPKIGGKSEQIITSTVYVLQIFDPLIQTVESNHPCVGSKNSCDKFCFAVPNKENVDSLERVCGCPYGEKLADDGISCVDNRDEQPPMFLTGPSPQLVRMLCDGRGLIPSLSIQCGMPSYFTKIN